MYLQSLSMEQDFGTWQPDGGALPRIEYSRAVLEELRLYAEEGFQKIPHGGIEVGALLLGERLAEGAGVRITEWRPMACDHARGPGFTLSDADRDALRSQIARCAGAEELRGLAVVGWCHTHTRSKIFLSLEDMAIHEVFFSEPWQIALVLRPQKDQPALAGFFCRDQEGVMRTESSALEFTVNADVSQSLKPRRPSAAPLENARLAAGRPEGLTSGVRQGGGGGRPDRGAFRQQAAAAASAGSGAASTMGRPLFEPAQPPAAATAAGAGATVHPILHHPAAVADPAGYPAAPSASPAGASRAFPRNAMWAALGLVALAGAGVASYLWSLDRAGKSASLKIEESDRNSLMISWDHTSPLVSGADRGTLRIVDGGIERKVPLSFALVRSGSVTYMREADDVDIRLSLFRDDRLMGQESAHFVGSNPLAASPSSVVGDDGAPISIDERRLQLQTEVSRLREVLREESTKTDRLREELSLLERTAASANLPPTQPQQQQPATGRR